MLSPTNLESANICVAPEWMITEGRISSEMGEYSLETTDIDVGTPKRSAQPTQGVPTCALHLGDRFWSYEYFLK